MSVAAGLRIALTSNANAIARAEAAIKRMDVLVAQAQQAGLMKMLNGRYREERMRAREQGRSFPPYAIIHKRFVQSLLRIASGEVPSDRWSKSRSDSHTRPHSQAAAAGYEPNAEAVSEGRAQKRTRKNR